MTLTNRDIQVWNEISEWENRLFQTEPTDFHVLYDKWLEQSFSLLPENIREQIFPKLDSWMFHLHAMVQSSQVQMDARERVLSAARVFNSGIDSADDMRIKLSIDQLNYIADQQMARHRLYSFVQGGASGSGGVLLLGADIPFMTVINVKTVQLVAMSYGYEVNTPFEMMMALRVFHIGTMPKRLQGAAWTSLLEDTENAGEPYIYMGAEELTNMSWLEQPLKQVLKASAILMFRRRLLQGVPLISMAIGAGANYQMTRQVSEFAQKYYQYRCLSEKREAGE